MFGQPPMLMPGPQRPMSGTPAPIGPAPAQPGLEPRANPQAIGRGFEPNMTPWAPRPF